MGLLVHRTQKPSSEGRAVVHSYGGRDNTESPGKGCLRHSGMPRPILEEFLPLIFPLKQRLLPRTPGTPRALDLWPIGRRACTGMIGQIFCLVRPTAAVLRDQKGKNSCVVLSEGSLIVVESSSDGGRKLAVRVGQREYWMFSIDLMARGADVTAEFKRTAKTTNDPAQ